MAEPRPAHRRPRQRGSLSVEAAYVLPVIIAAAMMFMELANIALAIDMGGTALERAIQQLRRDDGPALAAAEMESALRQRMAAASHGYLSEDNIATVSVERFSSLDEMGGGHAEEDRGDDMPVWRVTVDIRKDFITPLPRLLNLDSGAFRYRYQQVLGYLPAESPATP